MGRRASQQATFTKGELDPDLSERLDLEHYYDSLAEAENCLFHPQGGFSDRGGFQLVSDAAVLASGVKRRLRRRIIPVGLTAGMITAAHGGTAANLVDENAATLFTTTAVTGTTFVVCEIDLGTAQQVDLFDVRGFKSELAGADVAVAVQYYNGSAWVNFGDAIGVTQAKAIRQTARTRRFGVTPGGPAGTPVSARNWRVVILDGVGLGTISIAGIFLWRESTGLSPVRLVEVSREDGATYALAITERNIDVYQAQRYVASIDVPIAAQQIKQLGTAGAYDTLLLFHEMTAPQRITRQGSSGEWNIEPVAFTNVPNLSSAVVFSGTQDEAQDLDLGTIANPQWFGLFLGGQYAGAIQFTTLATVINDIAAKLKTVPGVSSGTYDVLAYWTGAGQTARIQFGAGNAGRAWPLVSAIPFDAPGVTMTTAVVTNGVSITGAYFSEYTGWPRAGAFVQQRLLLGGFRAAPTSYAASRIPTWWDFTNTGSPLTADLGFVGALDVDEVEVIQEIYAARHLQIFTDSAEFWTANDALSAEKPMRFVRATTQGLRRGVPLLFVDGATLFVQAGGDTLREFRYLDTEQSYDAEPMSVLCTHRISDVVDAGNRPARKVSEGNIILLLNADGTACAITSMRQQKVIAGAPWTTDGAFRAIMCGRDFAVLAAIERGGELYLEAWTPDLPLDFATRIVGAPASVITGAAHLGGRNDVWAVADGEVIGPLSVSVAGVCYLPIAAADVTYGLAPDWRVRGQTVREKLQQAQPFRAPGRIYEMGLALKQTGALALGTNGGAHREVSLLYTGSALAGAGPLAGPDSGAPGLPLMQRLFTGTLAVEGLLGVSDHPYWELSRPIPAPVTVKAVRVELSDKGD